MSKYSNLSRALSAFMEDLWLPFEDSIGSINLEIEGGMISKSRLVEEFADATSDQTFNWLDLAKESQLLTSPEAYSSLEISNYVKWLLQDYLYPEKALTEAQKQELGKAVMNILKDCHDNDGWCFSYDLHEKLKKEEKYAGLEYYNLHQINYKGNHIECKPISDKDREVGYLRYKGN